MTEGSKQVKHLTARRNEQIDAIEQGLEHLKHGHAQTLKDALQEMGVHFDY